MPDFTICVKNLHILMSISRSSKSKRPQKHKILNPFQVCAKVMKIFSLIVAEIKLMFIYHQQPESVESKSIHENKIK